MKLHYAGIMEGHDLDSINENTFNKLLKHDVFCLFKENVNFTDEIFFSESISLQNYFVYKSNCYTLNLKLATEIYESLKEFIEFKDDTRITINSLSIELNKFISIDEKNRFLNSVFKKEYQIFEKAYIEEDLFNYDGSILFEGLCKDEPSSAEWKDYILDVILNSPITLKFHLLLGEYNHFPILFLKKGLIEDEWDYIKYWQDWFRLHEIKKFCLNELQKGKKDILKKSKNRKLTPLQFICYIDKLRYSQFASLEDSEKLMHLNNITGGHNHDVGSQLLSLEKLVELNTNDYETLMDNQSNYSKLLREISKIDDTNTRKKIRSFVLSQMPNKKVSTLKEDQLSKYNKACSEVKNAFININKYFG